MRQWLIDAREDMVLSRRDLATLCVCSKKLIDMLEFEDAVTHPQIARRIAHFCRLSVKQYNELVPECRRVKRKMPPLKKGPSEKDYFSFVYAKEKRYKNQR